MNATEGRLRWATSLIRRGRAVGALPRYGSPAWVALPDTDHRKVAAVVVAAECWWVECDTEQIRQRLKDEMAVEAQIQAHHEAERFASTAGEVRQTADRPTWEKVRERWHTVAVPCASGGCPHRVDIDWRPDWLDAVAYCATHEPQGVAS